MSDSRRNPDGGGSPTGVRDMSVLEAGASPLPSDPGTNARNRLVSASIRAERVPGGAFHPRRWGYASGPLCYGFDWVDVVTTHW